MSCSYNITLYDSKENIKNTYNLSDVNCTTGQQFTINQGSTSIKPFTFSCPTGSFSQPAEYSDGSSAGVYSGSCLYKNSNNITGGLLFTIIFSSLTCILLLILIITLYKCRKSA